MFRFFKMQNDGAEIGTKPTWPWQLPSVSASQREHVDEKMLLDLLTSLSKINGVSAVQHGARLAVVGELLVSVLMHLPAEMRAHIVDSFRSRIEDVMSLGDDRSLPEQFHSALLREVNRYLNALR